jgi:hypothetical protein
MEKNDWMIEFLAIEVLAYDGIEEAARPCGRG